MTRCCNNYGPYQFPEKLIPLMIHAVRDRPLPVYGDGMNVRDWIHVEDHNRGLLAALERGTPGQVYNLGASCERHNIDIVKQVLALVGKPESLITYVKDRLGHDRRYAIDASKAHAALGWAPRHRFEEGLGATVRWYVEHRPVVGAHHLRGVPRVLREAVRGPAVRIAVTGANGLLGGEAVAQRRRRRAPRGAGPRPRAVRLDAARLGPGAFRYAEANLGDGHSVEAALLAFQAEAVLHAGAATDVDGCERDPALAWSVNVGGTEQAARACRALGARLVAVSTDYVFDGEAGPYGEEDLPNPRGAYARTKRCGEEAALLLALDCAVARVAVVYSGRPGAKATFATQVVEKLGRGEPVKAFSDQLVSTTLASSGAARCLELLLETSYQGVLHASDATVLSRVDFAGRVARRFGLAGEIVPVLTADVKLPAPRPLRAGLKVERAAALLRHKPLAIDEALDRFFEEWRSRSAPRPS